MELSRTQDYAIQARLAAVLGATVFDRVFVGVRFAESDGPLLYVYSDRGGDRRRLLASDSKCRQPDIEAGNRSRGRAA